MAKNTAALMSSAVLYEPPSITKDQKKQQAHTPQTDPVPPQTAEDSTPHHRPQHRTERTTDNGDSDDGDDDQPDQLVPDPQVQKELGGISAMTLWRWSRDPALGFPPAIQIRGRNFRSRKQLERWKAEMLRRSIGGQSKAATAGEAEK